MEKIKLKPCPVCGKTPKVKCTLIPGIRTYVKIQCKPFFRRKHLSVTCGTDTEERAYSIAAEVWNRRTDNGE